MPNFSVMFSLAMLVFPSLAMADSSPSSPSEYGWFEPASRPVARAHTLPEHFAEIQAGGNDAAPEYARGEDADLLNAVGKNEIENVRKLLLNGANPNVRDSWLDSALLRAVRQDNFEMIVLLLEYGANVNVKGRGYTPLAMAAEKGNRPVVKLLLRAGADTDQKNDDGNSPLHVAALMNRMDVAVTLLNAQADLTLRNKKRMTPLALAAAEGQGEVVSMLMSWGGCRHVDECRDRY